MSQTGLGVGGPVPGPGASCDGVPPVPQHLLRDQAPGLQLHATECNFSLVPSVRFAHPNYPTTPLHISSPRKKNKVALCRRRENFALSLPSAQRSAFEGACPDRDRGLLPFKIVPETSTRTPQVRGFYSVCWRQTPSNYHEASSPPLNKPPRLPPPLFVTCPPPLHPRRLRLLRSLSLFPIFTPLEKQPSASSSKAAPIVFEKF